MVETVEDLSLDVGMRLGVVIDKKLISLGVPPVPAYSMIADALRKDEGFMQALRALIDISAGKPATTHDMQDIASDAIQALRRGR